MLQFFAQQFLLKMDAGDVGFFAEDLKISHYLCIYLPGFHGWDYHRFQLGVLNNGYPGNNV